MYMPEYYEELDKETTQRVADYFDAWDLVEYLGISTEDIIEAFKDKVQDVIEDIEELMEVKRV